MILKMPSMRSLSVFNDQACNRLSQGLFSTLTATFLAALMVLPVAAQAQDSKSSVKKRPVATVAKSVKKAKVSVGNANKRMSVAAQKAVPMRASFGQMAGLHAAADPLDLRSSVALVIDQDTHEVLFRKNDHAVLPIASLTKLMTGLVISEAHLPMAEMIVITQADVDTEKGSSSRLAVGTVLSRGDCCIWH